MGERTVSNEISFLPPNLRSNSPEFLVWWTGTLGQAEWLISHTPTLRGRSAARECPKNLAGLPDKTRPLMALEQPDLVVTLPDGTGLLSIEITEQQEFGLNAQQRMARFWSAVACGVPSAYLLPVESYQIEKASESLALIMDEPNDAKKEVLLSSAVLRDVRGSSLWRAGIRSRDEMIANMEQGASAVPKSSRRSALDFWRKHFRRVGDVRHIPVVPHDEHLHKIDGIPYKAYLRSTGMPTAMLLEWMAMCSDRVPTYPFKMQSNLQNLFRTNGVSHTMEDSLHPHLSFRNLPPAPGASEVVSTRSGRDEMSLFIDFVDAVLTGSDTNGLDREMFVEPGEYYSADSRAEWRRISTAADDLQGASSGDYQVSGTILKSFVTDLRKSVNCSWTSSVSDAVDTVLDSYTDFHVYKILCSVNRGLSDPYSGALSVRDVLFCRDGITDDLTKFVRSSGLVFFVDFTGQAAKGHPFIYSSLARQYATHVKGGSSTDPLEQLRNLIECVRIETLPKDIRCHLLFSDLVLVRRTTATSVTVEAIPGIAGLVRLGLADSTSIMLRSVTS